MASIYNIAILYSSEDDQSVHDGGNGWVTSFDKFLGALLKQISKDREIKIHKVSENDLAVQGEAQYSVLISILSDDFFQNENLRNCATRFFGGFEEKDKVVNGVSRLFKVLKCPPKEDHKLEGLEDVIGYDFYKIDPSTGSAQEFHRFFGSEAERQFWMKLVDMAYDIQGVISYQEKKATKETKEIGRDKTVYLASTGVDMVIQRDIVKRELVRHGYKVLPDQILPRDETALKKMIKKDLSKSRLSIHLIGEDYGYKPIGSDKSVVDIQNASAEEHNFDILSLNQNEDGSKVEFNRLIWIPPNMKNVSERQQIFIGDLIANAALLDEAEVLRIPLQELKSIIRNELVTTGLSIEQEDDHHDLGKKTTSVYVIYDQLDEQKCKPILDSMANQGFKLLRPSFEGNFVDIRYIHQENLRRCDASFIFQGSATNEWVITKVQDVLKSPGFGRDRPMKVNALCLKNKEVYISDVVARSNAMVISGMNGSFSEEALHPFFSKLM